MKPLTSFAQLVIAGVLFSVSVKSATIACERIVATNVSEVEYVFHECGAAVLQMESFKPPMKMLAEILLETSHVQEDLVEPHSVASSYHFTTSLRPAFQRSDFPSFAAIAFAVNESLDAEFCLSGGPVPCEPVNYRYAELEPQDIIFVDPVRARFRLCDPAQQFIGCIPPKGLEIGRFFHYHAISFVLGDKDLPLKPSSTSRILVGENDDQDRLLQVASLILKGPTS